MWSFKFQMHQNPFSARAPPRTPVGELMTLPQIPIWLGRGHRELKCGTHNMGISALDAPSPKEAEARQTSWIFLKIPPPGFSWKSLGNLLG